MGALDIVILAVFVFGFVKGLMSGFFRQVVSIVGFLVGLLVASLLYTTFGDWLAPHIGTDVSVSRPVAFVLIWIGVPLLLSLLAFLLTKLVETVKLGGVNRLAGALVASVKYLLFLSCLLNVADRIQLIPEDQEKSSYLYEPVRGASEWVFEVCEPHINKLVEGEVQL